MKIFICIAGILFVVLFIVWSILTFFLNVDKDESAWEPEEEED